MENEFIVHLASTESYKKSLQLIREKKAGLDQHRINILNRVPNTGDWANFPNNSITIRDLAYISAFTEHEFALFRGKEDYVLHGEALRCNITDELFSLVKEKHLKLVAHSHPDHDIIIPSLDDRKFLKLIGQKNSVIISFITGQEVTYGSNLFDI